MVDFARRRQHMVERHLAGRDITDPAVLAAMGQVPREEFLPPEAARSAYDDRPLPIGQGQTISQPYVVALMIQAVEPRPSDRVLEIGTGSGYAAAVLSRVVARVYTIERHPELASQASGRWAALGLDNIEVRVGDGSLGWPEQQPFDGIIVTAAAPKAPPSLVGQLAVGGRMVVPVGPSSWAQRLIQFHRRADASLEESDLGGVAFVPLVGAEGW